MKKYIRKIISILHPAKLIYFDQNKDYKNTILLLGSGRSGTTFLSEIINYKNDFRYIFEPFNNKKLKILKNFSYRPYFNENNIEKHTIAKKIFSGDIQGLWVNKFNKKIFTKKRLIKDIRINFLVSYIQNNFPDIRLVCMIRHPFAVIDSKIRANFNYELDSILEHKNLVSLYFQNIEKEILHIYKKGSTFEKHMLQWCIENYVMLKQIDFQKTYLVFFENILTNPAVELEKLFKYLKIPYTKEILSKIKKPSGTTKKKVIDPKNIMQGWSKNISPQETKKGYEILKLFQLDKLYDKNAIPNIKNWKLNE